MKIKAIAALCKQRGKVTLYTDASGVQWVGDGLSLYALPGLPKMDKNTVLTVLDVPEEVRGHYDVAYIYDQGREMEEDGLLNSERLDVNILDKAKDVESFTIYGETLLQLTDGLNSHLIFPGHLKPLQGTKGLTLAWRQDGQGREWIIAREGLWVVAAIHVARIKQDELRRAFRGLLGDPSTA